MNKSRDLNTSNTKFSISTINTRGLSNAKVYELEELIENDNDILCITETQMKHLKVNFSPQMEILNQMRELDERKGGGILFLYPNDNIEMEKIETKNKDILCAKCTIKKFNFIIICVYLSVDDLNLNKQILSEVEDLLSKNSETETIMLGDFNSHIGFLGSQKVNRNGELFLKFIENTSLIILNDDPKTEGLITWKQGERNSVIDFILVNGAMYEKFESMQIDEEQTKFDLSDHNLLTANFNMKNNSSNKKSNNIIDNRFQ